MERFYGLAGLFLFFFGIFSAYFQVNSLAYSYAALCIGLFLVFDSLDFYLDNESLIDSYPGYGSPLTAVLLGGVFIGFVVEFYGVMTGMWGGMYYSDLGGDLHVLIADYYIDMTIS